MNRKLRPTKAECEAGEDFDQPTGERLSSLMVMGEANSVGSEASTTNGRSLSTLG
jgi:hypothetical protein